MTRSCRNVLEGEGYITIEICQRAYFMDAHRYAREAFDYVTGYMAGQ